MLAVDIGNTFTRMVAFAGETIRARWSFRTRALEVDGLTAAFREIRASSETDDVLVASVAPNANAVVDSAAERAGLVRRFIRPGADAIIASVLTTPETTGVDRLLAALAAGAMLFPGEATGYVVAQCGTAATIDRVDAEGVFRGGYILPGPTLWLEALGRAAQLPDLSDETMAWGEVAAGTNTHDAIVNGVHLGLPLTVASMALLAGAGAPVAVTGGWGEAVCAHLQFRHRYDRDLVLHGIRIFAERGL